MLTRFSIKVQLVLIIAFTSGLVLLGAFGAFLSYDLANFREKLVADMRTQASIIGKNSAAALAFGDEKVAGEVLASLRDLPEIEQVALFTSDGKILASVSHASKAMAPSAPTRSGSEFKDNLLQTSQVIGQKGEKIGSLTIVSNFRDWVDRRNTYVLGVVIVFFIALLVAGLIGSYLQRLISRPLLTLSDAMDRISSERNYGLRVEYKSQDEIGRLVSGFNGMLSEIEARDAELSKANEELDRRVQRRTAQLEREVAERRAAEAELRISQQQLADFFEFAPLGIVRFDQDGVLMQANRAALDLYGYAESEFVGRNILEFAKEKEEMREALEQLASGESLKSLDATILCNGGGTKEVEIDANVLWDGDKFVYARFFTKDVTVIKEALLAQQDKERAERANHAKSEFLSRMSHELRTPMNAILGFGQLLEMEPLSDSQRECVDHILKGGRHLLSLINEVLNISRIEAGSMSISVDNMPLMATIQDAVELVNPLAMQRGITVSIGELEPEIYVLADRQRVSQVLINLLSNAVKYNVDGGWVSIEVAALSKQRIRISVVDGGLGISKNMADRLWIPFDRMGAELTTVEGTGLGLPYSKSLVDAMGGTLYLDSGHDAQGSRFVLELNLGLDPANDISSQHMVMEPLLQSIDNQSRTVLVIEDNVANVKLVDQLFASKTSHSLIVAMQGAIGVEFALTHKPDLILLDVNLPDIQGPEVARRLRMNSETASIPIIVISADATKRTRDQFDQFNIVSYLSKPINIKELMRLVDHALGEEYQISA